MPTQPADTQSKPTVAIIGAGPAGLMAAEQIASAGIAVEVFDSKPSVARKFLLAGIGGMNITHAEPYEDFVTRYGEARPYLQPMLDAFTPQQLRDWIHDLGIETFVGSSNRVFPTGMKAAPLLRAWLHRLREQGVVFHPRHRWSGWVDGQPQAGWRFDTPDGEIVRRFDAVVLALGGASWAKLGSDGRWFEPLAKAGITLNPLLPSNCGFEMNWSAFVQERFGGTPIKNIALSITTPGGREITRKGEFLITGYGIEGSLIYALSAPLRDLLFSDSEQPAELRLDWLPAHREETIQTKLSQPRKGLSFANLLRKRLHLPPVTSALLKECCPQLDTQDPKAIARALKSMPLRPVATRPIDEAISSAGGVPFDEVNSALMLNKLPGVFVAGEMLDWEAPTGGYLLTGCFATGKRAGQGLVRWMSID
ncbi:NAD(FAD)-utilizing dehydrogenase [Marinobacterium lacunae]|uniref:NAD(FAD)-utilizing dehydrogenase n=1 Tax=Marinobacterium lacunae TaxID=1232683 RepID=A0A081G496_9GAMM|nr:TIGR03862 family flavoprotein [Marinobacterium lacunae]KEA65601.1 NAD(FAD)-utilizing dehydrogenase [Marinobacterium lacunae]